MIRLRGLFDQTIGFTGSSNSLKSVAIESVDESKKRPKKTRNDRSRVRASTTLEVSSDSSTRAPRLLYVKILRETARTHSWNRTRESQALRKRVTGRSLLSRRFAARRFDGSGFAFRCTLRRAPSKLDSKLNRVANSALGIRETRPETGKRIRFPRLSLKKARSISFATDWSNRTYSRRANDVGRSFISREELAKTKSLSSSDWFDGGRREGGKRRKYTWRRVIGATARSLSPFQAIVAYANVID